MSAVYARCIRRFLYKLSRVEISVYAVYPDTCGRSYPYIFVYADVTVSEAVLMRMLCWLILWDVRIRIGYVWTVVYDSYALRVDADIFVSAWKNLRIQKFPDTCGRGLSYFFAIIVIIIIYWQHTYHKSVPLNLQCLEILQCWPNSRRHWMK